MMPIIKVLLFCIFIWLCSIPFSLIEEINFENLDFIHPLVFDVVGQVAGVLIVLAALLLIFRVFKKYNFENIFIVRKGRWQGFVKGTGIGTASVLACAILALLNGNVSFTMGNVQLLLILGYIIFFILVGVMEEFVFRSFPLLVLSERYPLALSILLTGSLFGLAHYFNPGFSWLAMLNISLIGVLLAICVLLKRNIYWAIGIHFGWNFTQGILLGYKVSGTESNGFLVAKPMGETYLSGGSFGIESSIFCTLIIVVLIVYLLVRYQIAPVVEIMDEEELEEEI